METVERILCPMFKMAVGIIHLVLSGKYPYNYCVYDAASFGILIIWDTLAFARKQGKS
jgi:hypothetical protein